MWVAWIHTPPLRRIVKRIVANVVAKVRAETPVPHLFSGMLKDGRPFHDRSASYAMKPWVWSRSETKRVVYATKRQKRAGQRKR
jgi:hypothetical protein